MKPAEPETFRTPLVTRQRLRRRHRAGLLLAGFAFVAPLARPTQAEDSTAAKGPIATYDVYVTSEMDLVGAVTTVREISRETIVDEQARDLDEAVQHQPSVVVRRGAEGVARIDLRGLRTRQMLLLVDGIPLRTTNDGNFDPTLVPSQIIESIDITFGASSVLYGDGPLAGVMQVRTRSGKEGVEVQAQADLRDGSQALGEASVSAGAGDFEGFTAGSYRSQAGYEMSGDYVPTSLENGGLRENSDRDQGNFFAKLGWTPGERSRVDVLFDYRKGNFGVPWSTVADPNDPFAQRARFERMNEVEGFLAQLSGQHGVTDDLDLRSWAYVSRQTEQLSRYDDTDLDSITARGTFQLEDTATIAGGAVHGRQDLGAFGALRFAVNGRFERFESMGLVNERVSGSTVLVAVDTSNDYGAWSLGAEYEVEPFERFGLVVGYAHAFLEASAPVDTDGPIFLAGAHYDLPTNTRLRASAARKLRFPSIRQLYDVTSGNPLLQTENCWCYEAAIEQTLPYGSQLALIGYWMDLDDFIERLSSGTPFQNRQSLRNRGFELVGTSRPVAGLQLRLGYTFLDSVDTSPGSAFAGTMPNRPRHKIDGVAQYTFPTATTLRAALTWAADTTIYTRTTPLVAATLPDFVVLDLVVEQRLVDDALRIYLGVQNVTDALWTYNYGFPQAGRTVYGGLEVRFH